MIYLRSALYIVFLLVTLVPWALVAVVFVIVGGVKYLTSQGEPAQTKQALHTLAARQRASTRLVEQTTDVVGVHAEAPPWLAARGRRRAARNASDVGL